MRGPNRADFLQASSAHTHVLPGALGHVEEGQQDGGGEQRESWTFGEGSRVGEAPFRVTSRRVSEPNVAGKEGTLAEDLLRAGAVLPFFPAGVTSTLGPKQP